MVLLGIAGWSLQRFAAVPHALLIGVVTGMLAAQFVPGNSCAVPGRNPGERPGDPV